MPSGGYRPPSNPAAVSGPGALSRRTDQPQPMQKLYNPKYGEQSDFQEIQSGAPMSAPGMPGGAPTAGVAAPTGLSAPSARPGEPVTAGAAVGAGPGPSALNLPSQGREEIKRIYGPVFPALLAYSQTSMATQEFKDAVMALQAILSS